MKILLIAGHGNGDPGACSSYGTESTETRKVVATMQTLLGNYNNCTVTVYDTSRNCYSDVCNGTTKVSFGNFDCVFEVHFNSASATTANGTEIYITSSQSNSTMETAVMTKMAALGFTNRGVKTTDFAVIKAAKKAGAGRAALMEVCFISNSSDMSRYNSKYSSVCSAMVEAIASFYGLTKKSTTSTTTTTTTTTSSSTTSTTTTTSVAYRVKTSAGKQLGAFNVLANAKALAQANKAIVYNASGAVVVSYVATSTTKYLNLHPIRSSWNVYPTTKAPVTANKCGALAPKTYGGLSYQILANPQTDVYTIQTQVYGKVNIYAPADNESSITTSPLYP